MAFTSAEQDDELALAQLTAMPDLQVPPVEILEHGVDEPAIAQGAPIVANHLDDRLIELVAIAAQLSVDQSTDSVLGKAILLRHLVPQIDKCAVVLLDKEGRACRVAGVIGMTSEHSEILVQVEQEQRLWSTTATTAQPVSFPDVLQNRRMERLWPLVEMAGLRSIWLVPLVDSRGHTIGWIVFGSPCVFMPNDEDRAIAALFANHMVIALHQAELFEENQRKFRELSFLHRVSTRTGAAVADLDQTLQRLLNELGELMRPSAGLLMLRDQDGSMELKATYNLGREQWTVANELGLRLMELMIDKGKPLLLTDATKYEPLGKVVSVFGLRSAICTPLMVQHSMAGIVALGDTRANAYSQANLALLGTACNQASTALENAILFAETKRRQSEVIQQQKEMAAIFRSVSDGVMILGEQGKILAVNASLEALTGRKQSELVGSRCCDVFGRDCLCLGKARGSKERSGPTAGKRKGQTSSYIDITHTRKDGRKIDLSVGSTFIGLAGPRQGITIITARDVSERREVERMKADFFSTVSHDLRTFLTAIKGYAATLRHMEKETSPQQRRLYLEAIDSATNRISRLVSDFLDLSRIEANHLRLALEPLYIDCLIGDIVSEMQAQTLQHIIRVRSEGPMPLLEADRGKIERVVINLLDNAVKYSPKGGTIFVTIRQVGNRRELNRLVGRDRAMGLAKDVRSWVLVTVQDHGIGIPEDQADRLFDKFYRVEDGQSTMTRGTGLGLYICRTIIHAHGGRIWAKGGLGQGTTISFVLPACADNLLNEDW